MASKKPAKGGALDTAYMNTDSGPATGPAGKPTHPALQRAAAVGATTGAIPHNANKEAEYGEQAARCPYAGAHVGTVDPAVGASSLSEKEVSDKTGDAATPGVNQNDGTLPRVRADGGGRDPGLSRDRQHS